MRVTQGCFSFLPDLTDEPDFRQVQYCLTKGLGGEHRVHRRPASRNNFWEMVGCDVRPARCCGCHDGAHACRKVYGKQLHPDVGVRFQPWLGIAATVVHRQRPKDEPGFRLSGMRSMAATSATPRLLRVDRPKVNAIRDSSLGSADEFSPIGSCVAGRTARRCVSGDGVFSKYALKRLRLAMDMDVPPMPDRVNLREELEAAASRRSSHSSIVN